MSIKEEIRLLLGGKLHNPGKIIHYCKNLALAYLKSKVSAGNHYILNLSSSLEDLAWDCIADLFERNGKNQFVQIEIYFEPLNLEQLSDAEIQIKLRRLVFSKVNDGLFRNFGVYDMSLSKIIRNLKLATGQGITVRRNATDNYLAFSRPGLIDPNKPMMPPEFLEIKLTHRLSIKMNTPEILAELEKIFIGQERYQKKYPLVQIARVIRRAFINMHDKHKTIINPEIPTLRKEKIIDYLRQSLEECESCFRETYVKKGKITKENLERYLTCIEGILRHKYVTESSFGDSYYEHFKQEFPEITKEAYREQHRKFLEYMVKRVREDLFYKLRKVI